MRGRFSTAHRLHDQASVAVLLAVPAAAVVSGVQSTGAWRIVSFVAAVASVGLLGWFGVAYERDTPRSGIVQRAMVVVNWTWIALLGVTLA